MKTCVETKVCCSCRSTLVKGKLGIAVFVRPDGTEHNICGDCTVPDKPVDCTHAPIAHFTAPPFAMPANAWPQYIHRVSELSSEGDDGEDGS
jgi:hypothetical protein